MCSAVNSKELCSFWCLPRDMPAHKHTNEQGDYEKAFRKMLQMLMCMAVSAVTESMCVFTHGYAWFVRYGDD